MSGWAGFSDEELRRMQQKDAPVSRGRRAAPAARSRQQIQREKALQVAVQRSTGAAGCPESQPLPPEQQLTKPPPEQQLTKPPPPPPAPGKDERRAAAAPAAAPPVKEEGSAAVKELEKQEVELREKTKLEQLQLEQKLIEEGNKRKKALLAKTIAEKSKQTQAEAVKLKRIQRELQALDDMVSNDIGILRGRIEQASWDYSNARKRYERAEAEYVTAKLELHKKTEVKEQLTEHLCAIIQQNELRKAHKLEELMMQLQLQPSEEQEEEEQLKEEESRAPHMLRQGEQDHLKEENGVGEKQEVPSKDCREEPRHEEGVAIQNHTPPQATPPQAPPPDNSGSESVSS